LKNAAVVEKILFSLKNIDIQLGNLYFFMYTLIRVKILNNPIAILKKQSVQLSYFFNFLKSLGSLKVNHFNNAHPDQMKNSC